MSTITYQDRGVKRTSIRQISINSLYSLKSNSKILITIYTLNTITATIEKVPGLVVKLDEAEKTIAAELKSDSKMRGQGEKTIFEDNIDI